MKKRIGFLFPILFISFQTLDAQNIKLVDELHRLSPPPLLGPLAVDEHAAEAEEILRRFSEIVSVKDDEQVFFDPKIVPERYQWVVPPKTEKTLVVKAKHIKDDLYQIETSHENSNGEPLKIDVNFAKDHKKGSKWALRRYYGNEASGNFHQAPVGNAEIIPKNEMSGIEYGKVIYEGFKGWPVDVTTKLGLMVSRSNPQGGHLPLTASIGLERSHFPWNKFIRTRIGVAQGLSYVEGVPMNEIVDQGNRGGEKSFLNHLEASLSFNSKDLLRIIRAGEVFNRDFESFEDTWLMIAVPYQSSDSSFLGLGVTVVREF